MSNEAPPSGEVSQVVEHLFRHEAGKMVATLTRIFGVEHLTLAEDVVQEALARALQTWPFYGVPQNPSAWIMRASRNLALDVVRREKVFRDKEDAIIHEMIGAGPGHDAPIFAAEEIADDRLRMMFICCHPLVPADARVALTLKTLCGFSVAEISRAFLTTEAATAKQLTRAKQKIREEKIAYEIPIGADLTRRLDSVLQSLYLLFNEGYKASSGDRLVREDICHEAIYLTHLLAEHPATRQPRTHALLALMLLNSARLPARVDGEGNLLLLQDQDRAQWDRGMITRGILHLAQSATGNEITEYHVQAGIAACHCAAPDYSSTDWAQILAYYDRLVEFDDSPVIALNRAVAIANLHGPAAGLDAVKAIPAAAKLKDYYLYYAVLGEFESRLQNPRAAAHHFRQALQHANLKSERAFLERKLSACLSSS
jgi:RNA polymerase sigma-70 factor (ECF subfamily)